MQKEGSELESNNTNVWCEVVSYKDEDVLYMVDRMKEGNLESSC